MKLLVWSHYFYCCGRHYRFKLHLWGGLSAHVQSGIYLLLLGPPRVESGVSHEASTLHAGREATRHMAKEITKYHLPSQNNRGTGGFWVQWSSCLALRQDVKHKKQNLAECFSLGVRNTQQNLLKAVDLEEINDRLVCRAQVFRPVMNPVFVFSTSQITAWDLG